MQLHKLNFSGHYEDEADQVAEQLQLLEPERDLERRLLAWAILPHRETVTDDSARPDYTFTYELGDYLERGLYRLKIIAHGGGGEEWSAEIAAGLVVTGAPALGQRVGGFAPFWFISERLHFEPSDPSVRERYPGETFGRLEFNRWDGLPHRRLFRATV